MCSFFHSVIVLSVWVCKWVCRGRFLYDYLLEQNSNMFVYVVIQTTLSWITCFIHTDIYFSTVFSLFLSLRLFHSLFFFHFFDLSTARLEPVSCYLYVYPLSHRGNTTTSFASVWSLTFFHSFSVFRLMIPNNVVNKKWYEVLYHSATSYAVLQFLRQTISLVLGFYATSHFKLNVISVLTNIFHCKHSPLI